MKTFAPLAALALALAGCADVPRPDAERIQGHWIVVDFRSPNQTEDRGQRRKHALVSEETWSEQFQGETYEDFEYRIDPGPCPKHLDLIFTDASGRRLTVRAIYEIIDGNRMRVCFGSPPVVNGCAGPEYVESIRPLAFEPTAGPLVRYHRKTE
ncbi:MAG: hypothetical protein ACKODX_14840 [Gemmata sp.]